MAAKKHIIELETPAATVAPSMPSADSSASSKVRLPKVSLPVFAGKTSAEYKTFMNKFESLVDKEKTLDEVQKLLYLQKPLLMVMQPLHLIIRS